MVAKKMPLRLYMQLGMFETAKCAILGKTAVLSNSTLTYTFKPDHVTQMILGEWVPPAIVSGLVGNFLFDNRKAFHAPTTEMLIEFSDRVGTSIQDLQYLFLACTYCKSSTFSTHDVYSIAKEAVMSSLTMEDLETAHGARSTIEGLYGIKLDKPHKKNVVSTYPYFSGKAKNKLHFYSALTYAMAEAQQLHLLGKEGALASVLAPHYLALDCPIFPPPVSVVYPQFKPEDVPIAPPKPRVEDWHGTAFLKGLLVESGLLYAKLRLDGEEVTIDDDGDQYITT